MAENTLNISSEKLGFQVRNSGDQEKHEGGCTLQEDRDEAQGAGVQGYGLQLEEIRQDHPFCDTWRVSTEQSQE
ncbi:MAG: hypothetical protein ACTSRU_19895 [Candidatus Hodarchaeales archaeon]